MRAVVTGSASGIGLGIALRLAEDAHRKGERARLLLVDLAVERFDGALASLRAFEPDLHLFAGDMSDSAVPARIIEKAAAAFGGLDAVVSNAAIVPERSLVDMTIEEFDRTLACNVRATWLLAKAARLMLKESRGCLVATASIGATEPVPLTGNYSTSKAALVMLIQQLANEWGPDGIRFNTVSPGTTLTARSEARYKDEADRAQWSEKIPLRRLGQPADIAAAVSFLISSDAAFISGIDIKVDGAMTTTLMNHHRRARAK